MNIQAIIYVDLRLLPPSNVLIIILLLLSFGRTVTFKNSMDFDIYVPLSFMLGIVNIIMTLLNKITDGEYDKHHMFDTIPAYLSPPTLCQTFGILILLGGIAKVLINLKSEDNSIHTTNNSKMIFLFKYFSFSLLLDFLTKFIMITYYLIYHDNLLFNLSW